MQQQHVTELVADYNRSPAEHAGQLAQAVSEMLEGPGRQAEVAMLFESIGSLRELWEALNEETIARLAAGDRGMLEEAGDEAFKGEDDVAVLVEETLLPSLTPETRQVVAGVRPLHVYAASEAVSMQLFSQVSRRWQPCRVIELDEEGGVWIDGECRAPADDVAQVIAGYGEMWTEQGEPGSEARRLARFVAHAAREQPQFLQHFDSYPSTRCCALVLTPPSHRIESVFKRWALMGRCRVTRAELAAIGEALEPFGGREP